MNTFTGKHLAFLLISFFTIFTGYTYAGDSVASVFTAQSASTVGSSNSIVSVDSDLLYINKGDNSSIVGNYFNGYYHDSVLGYFKVDSLNSSENVRVTGSTGICPSDYGYKLGGYAYSEAFGFMDFDYDENIFVYYCLVDSTLHGYAYSSLLGFQSFENISFDIGAGPILASDEPLGTSIFVNDTTDILDNTIGTVAPGADVDDSNFNYNTIQNELLEFDDTYESLFYIIK